MHLIFFVYLTPLVLFTILSYFLKYSDLMQNLSFRNIRRLGPAQRSMSVCEGVSNFVHVPFSRQILWLLLSRQISNWKKIWQIRIAYGDITDY